MSFEGELSPSFDLKCLRPGNRPPDGWGLGHYPRGEPSASVWKEPAPPTDSLRAQLVANESLESSVFLMHVRSATWGALTDANTQPFVRTWGRRDWVMAHAGSLDRKPLDVPGPFEPVGSTDTEAVFCGLINRFHERGWRSLAQVDLEVLHGWLDEINEAVEDYVDDIAERIVQLGGQAEGTARLVVARSALIDYPPALSTGAEHVAALSDSLSAFGRTVRIGIDEADELEDKDTADLLTEVSRGIDKWLWFVEAHQQAEE